MNTFYDKEQLKNLKYPAVQAYLLGTAWEKIIVPREDLALFHKIINGEEYEIALPLSREFKDYDLSLARGLSTLAISENRQFNQVLSDLLLDPADIIRFKVSNRETLSGTILFVEGFKLLESAKKVLIATACDIIRPEKYHKRLSFKAAQHFIEQCRIGLTEKGSFIAQVMCPFIEHTSGEKPHQLTIFEKDRFPDSLTRRVTSRLMNSLSKIKICVDRGEMNKIVDEENEIISVNFLESLLALKDSKYDSELEISAKWSPFASGELQGTQTVKLTDDYLQAIESMANKMSSPDEEKEAVFIGKVSQLKAETDPGNRKEGEIILNFMGDGEKVIRAKVILSIEDYDNASIAHKEGKDVLIKGILKTSGRTKVIEQPKFSVIKEPVG